MFGLMQQRPLLIANLVDYVATWHAETEIVSRDPAGVMHRSSYGQVAAPPNASPTRSPGSVSPRAIASRRWPGIPGGISNSITA